MVLTDKGQQAFDAAMALQIPWVDQLSDGQSVKNLPTVHRVILALRESLEGSEADAAD